MFDDIVARYDLLNGVLSLGLDRRWRRATMEALRIRPGDRALDLGCGTGDLSRLLAGAGGRVVGIDISHKMLLEAKVKLRGDTQLALGSGFALPMRDRTFAAAGSAFVLRNLFDLETAFRELARVLAPSGRLALVDITEPRSRLLRRLFDAYFGTVAPALGALVGKRDAYRYLVGSVAQLPPPAEVCAMLERAGFEEPRAKPLTGGMVTLFTAMKARE